MPSVLDQAFAPLQTALNLRAYQQELLSANIANADTPNYKAKELNFAAAMQGALAGQGGKLPMQTDQPGQVSGAASTAAAAAAYVSYQAGGNARLDGNTVDMDHQQTAFMENSIQYEAALTFTTNKVTQMNSALSTIA